eukprot:SAG11_NODE_30740_length_298_cov_0.763819_1_plen_43_part_00
MLKTKYVGGQQEWELSGINEVWWYLDRVAKLCADQPGGVGQR